MSRDFPTNEEEKQIIEVFLKKPICCCFLNELVSRLDRINFEEFVGNSVAHVGRLVDREVSQEFEWHSC